MAKSREKKRRLRGGRVLLVLVLLGIGYLIYLTVHVTLDGLRDERRPADVILVLGNAQRNGYPAPILQARLDHALALYRDGYAPYLLFTGGKRKGDRFTEAETGKRYAMERGVPESAIFLENHGNSTWQEMQSSAKIIHDERLQRVILVSDWFHAFRLRRMARDLGMDAAFSPVPRSAMSKFTTRARATIREVVAYAIYRLVGM